jgi:hypothetical protein
VLLIAATTAIAGCGASTESRPAGKNPPVAEAPSVPAPPLPAASETLAAPVPGPQPESHSLAAGTVLPVRLISVIDSSAPFAGFAVAVITDNVNGTDGHVAIPAKSQLAIAVRDARRTGPISTLRLGAYSINIAGRQYQLSNGATDAATLVFTEDAGKGDGHSSVHLQYGTELAFKLDKPLQLR